MKKLFFSCFLLIIFALPAVSQLKEGYIRYDIKFDNTEFSDQEKAMLPTMSEIWFKDSKMLMHMPAAMGIDTRVLVTGTDMTMLMDMMGNKMAIKSGKEEMEKSAKSGKSYKVKTLVDEKKMIAGYECKKAIMTSEDGEEVTLWYSDKLRVEAAWYYQMNGITGCPMEFTMNNNGLTFNMLAVEVKTVKPADDLFVIPADYKVMTQEELQKMFGGMK